MSHRGSWRKGFIRAEDLQDTHLEAFPYFPVDTGMSHPPFGEGEGSVAMDLGDPEGRSLTVEERIVDRLQAAEQQAQEIARQAYEEGFAAGETEGRAFGESQYKTYIQRLDEQLAELAATTQILRNAVEEELVALALAAAEHLAVQHITQSPGAVRALLEKVLEELPFPPSRGRAEGDAPMQVFLSPADLEELSDHFIGRSELSLQTDVTLSRGSLRIEAPQGILNATMEGRRERMLQTILQMKEERSP
jgi:flagellar biosynthesis/type III secretory pathway protein FliH